MKWFMPLALIVILSQHSASALAQGFELIYSYPADGSAVYLDSYMIAREDRVDFDGDGNPDIFTQDGAVMEIVTVDDPSHIPVVLWSYTLEGPFDGFGSEGAVNVTPHPGKEVIVDWWSYSGESSVLVLSSTGEVIWSFPDRYIQDFADFDGDGLDELLLQGAVAEIWDYTSTASSVSQPDSSRPMRLAANPNPFTAATEIRFATTFPGTVILEIFDSAGRLMSSKDLGAQQPGAHTVVWNGLDDRGRSVAAGVYHYRLRSGDWTSSRKVVLLR